MSSFQIGRDLIVHLTDNDAQTVLGLFDSETANDEAPSEFRAALHRYIALSDPA